ncbi:phosphatidylethanolamine-binding protein 4 [Callorhinchus milii]|uniref:phosphatidylethanolamine-binding protein 4 n=1 Tax=Callorhinchus milii TaxID=7868 RepID=UPI001C3F8674|nr:phosphatidylethanolamine-binding protein 4 [Callorhinchus milii]XP_042200492.1 phosphatidylethanolamine-binding protein 4 [Callorhinchus milii]
MNWLSFLFLAGLGCLAYQKTDVEDSICIVQNITGQDSNICSGDLEIIYPELGNVACSIILRCLEYQRKLSRDWGPPSVKSFQVDQRNMMYVLIMVDPDAPAGQNIPSGYWRHWLVINIGPENLHDGTIVGTELSHYRRPNPPPGTGFHHYQFFLYEQPANETIFLDNEERKSNGGWNMNLFVNRYRLGSPVASTQFLMERFQNGRSSRKV